MNVDIAIGGGAPVAPAHSSPVVIRWVPGGALPYLAPSDALPAVVMNPSSTGTNLPFPGAELEKDEPRGVLLPLAMPGATIGGAEEGARGGIPTDEAEGRDLALACAASEAASVGEKKGTGLGAAPVAAGATAAPEGDGV